jgi:DNA-binding LytR/AlgR family response regulator
MQGKINCLIIEDEPLAAEIIQDYIKQVPFLHLVATCGDAVFAYDILQSNLIDLIFLDIHLPKLKGFDFLNSLKNPPHIIVTSAYNEYALQGYEYNVLDYLQKPIAFNRFLKAINKIPTQQKPIPTTIPHKNIEALSLFFNVGKKKVKIFLDDILYIESLREYIRVVTRKKTILTKFQIGQIEKLLEDNNFIRVHRSFIVAKNKVEAFTAVSVEIENKEIPVGRSYKELVQSVFEIPDHKFE